MTHARIATHDLYLRNCYTVEDQQFDLTVSHASLWLLSRAKG